ncbi:MAG: IclR family transcriptional regulator [Anaerolineae bacterium]|nr:IclR family transcriptional regulator [Anaerolineae bacterium]
MAKSSSVKTIDRLLEILDCFSPEHSAWSLTELSEALDLPKSTMHRFLMAMEYHGILRRSATDKRWRLGYRLTIWGELAAQSTGLQHVARPVMRDLTKATGEMSLLTIYEHREVVCIERIETAHSVRLALSVGQRQPPHAGASSKILMAFLPESEIEAILQEQGLPKLCTNTVTAPDVLRAELEKIRNRGYAVSVEETDVGAWGVATPIFDRDGNVVASVGVAGPLLRLTGDLTESCVAECRKAAERISLLLQKGVEY